MIGGRALILGMLVGAAGAGWGQVAAVQPEVSFRFERAIAGVPVPRYNIEIRGDGTGAYHADLVVPQSAETQPVERTLQFSTATVQAALDGVRAVRASHAPCDAKLKNIADTGAKTLAYRDGEGEGSCSYNYSVNKGVMQLTELFQGIETTLEAGRALELKHRFDRLGLDAEMITLTASVDAGRAVALETIAPTLRSIAADTDLIERVRLRARKLLDRTADVK